VSDLYALAARALRTLDAETAHGLTIKALKLGLGPRVGAAADPVLATELCGLKLANPVGLAAGFDKNAETPLAMLNAGFGFVECGTVTPLPQAGNPRPRLFRLVEDGAVINRMGFNNEGLEPFAARLKALKRPLSGPVGANIGANKEAVDRMADYVTGLTRLWGSCDYFTVNISSPNTPGLRDLQSRAALEELTGRLSVERARLAAASGLNPPVFLKVAPDVAEAEVPEIVDVVAGAGFDGIIVSNTTITRPDSLKSAARGEAGGLSGAPLFTLSTHRLRLFHQAAAGRLVLIGAGGIGSGADAYAKIRAGASAVQFYSAMALTGPGLVLDIRKDLTARLKADGFASLAEAVGA
jgi:dihydroorotate dehydrogenase